MKYPLRANGTATKISTIYNIPVYISKISYVAVSEGEKDKKINEKAKTTGIRLKNHIPIFRQYTFKIVVRSIDINLYFLKEEERNF
jgi:hypothetical protein